MEFPGKDNKVATGTAIAGIGAIVGMLFGVDPEVITKFLSTTAQSQIAQAGFFFTMAAWLHSGRVKKSIGENFQILTTAIDNVAKTLSEDLKKQAELLESHAELLNTHGQEIQDLKRISNQEA